MYQNSCHLLVSGYKYEIVWENIGERKTWETNNEKVPTVITMEAEIGQSNFFY